ncbi:glycosyltransferase [Actinomyces provencensis]|uniref:glycosyltransferase n=1 Tax=Actinomyces provencensis TaxID=1720198 RepID=UPI00096ACAC9|nr:glycosyltransferase [Actinomyces provencensis]
MSTARSGVVALVVTRGDTQFLGTTLGALSSQTLAPDRVLVIDVGGTTPVRAVLPESAPPTALVVRAPGARTLGEAVRRAARTPDSGPALEAARWWWILHDDSAPEPTCLRELWEVADEGRTTAVIGPKQVSWDGDQVLEVGIDATRAGRRLEAIAPGEIDQGQYDDRSDVLAVGTAGMLVDREVWEDLGGTDPLLGPFGDGLEFGRRVRRAGYRVVLAPRARIRHARRSLEPCPPTGRPHARDASFRARRAAQLVNWFLAVPWWQVPLLVAALTLWSPLRSVGRLLTGASQLAPAEVGAWWDLVRHTPRLVRSRLRNARQATLPRSVLRPLEATPRALAEERRLVHRIRRAGLAAAPVDPLVVSSLRRHGRRTRGAVTALLLCTTLASLIVGARYLSGVRGAAWAGAPTRWGDLWSATWSAWIPGGDGTPGPADPLLIPLSLLSAPFTLLGVSAGTTWTWLLVLALPLAAWSAWLLGGALTTSVPARVAGALAWAALPALTVSASQGRLGAVLVHVLLPVLAWSWLRLLVPVPLLVAAGAEGDVTASTARHRSGAIGVGALALAGAACAAPWLLLPAVLLAALALALRRRRALGVAMAVVPALVLVAPTVVHQLRQAGGWAALLTTGGPALAVDPAASWQVLLGIPSAVTWHPWVWLLGLPGALLLVIAVAGGLRDVPGVWMVRGALAVAVGAMVVALALGHVDVAFTPSSEAAVVGATGTTSGVAHAWAAPALSLAGLALLIACLRASASPLPWDDPRHRPTRVLATVVGICAVATLGAWALPGPLQADTWDHVSPSDGPDVPAVSLQAQLSPRAGRVLVLTRDQLGVHAEVLRGPGVSVTDASAGSRLSELHALRAGGQDPADEDLARAAVTLVEYPDDSSVRVLAEHAIDTVLLPDVSSEDGKRMADALGRAPGVEKVGTTDVGDLWRVRPDDIVPARLTVEGTDSETLVDTGWLRTDVTLDEGVSGTLVLAERADPGWRATLDGVPLQAAQPASGTWRQAFALPASGHLVVEFSPWWLLGWRIASGVVLVGAAAAALPLRRHR